MGLLYLLVVLALALAYVAAVAAPVLLLSALGRVGAAAGVILVGFAARGLAGKYFHVWASEPLSFAYLPYFVGVAWALWYSTRPDRTRRSPLRTLARSPIGDRRRMDRNLLALVLAVTPATVVLNYAGEYLQRSALGYQTEYLALRSSWDYAKYFESGPLGVGLALFLGGLLYEGALLRLPPAASQAADDRRALTLLPLMLVPWLVIGAARVLTFHGIALAQGVAIYFFLIRRFAHPVSAPAAMLRADDAPDPPALAAAGRAPTASRRYAVIGAMLGAAVAAFALAGSGVDDAGALAIVAEQLFFITVPASVPLRTILFVGGDLRYESSAALVAFVLAAPVANGALVGWALGRGVEARWLRRGGAPHKKTSQSPAVTGS